MKFGTFRRLLFGEPIATRRMKHQLLPKYLALPVFASDALSSTAYATEEILLALSLAGVAALHYSLPIAFCIAALMAIVVLSYSQTVMAYPSGGGAYIVAKDNLGTHPSLVAGAALLTDYILTVAVSIASGVAAVTSAFPSLLPHRTLLCLVCIAFVTLANLRGAKESGKLFCVPTYLFILCMFSLIGGGLAEWVASGGHVPPMSQGTLEIKQPLTAFLLLRAFASGCAALTGIEAISDGVPAFQEPKSVNARKTLWWMAAILMTMFLGISFLAHAYHVFPRHEETVVSQVARAIFGKCWFYYVVQAATAMILILAANTSFADFPRLSFFLARDSFAPRQLANLGDRLVFSNGIALLGICSSLLIIVFQGDTHRLIPLYAVGVFTSFTLSQSGMVLRWLRVRGKNWKVCAFLNGMGAVTTAVVLTVIAVMKFTHGAWIIVLLIPLIVSYFRAVNRHYHSVTEQLQVTSGEPLPKFVRHHVIILVPGVHRGILRALAYARTICKEPEAVYVEINPAETSEVVDKWKQHVRDVPLRILKSPWRSITEPFLGYVDMLLNQQGIDLVTVVIPEFVTTRLWHRMLHNAAGLMLKFVLLFQRNVVVTNIRYHLDD